MAKVGDTLLERRCNSGVSTALGTQDAAASVNHARRGTGMQDGKDFLAGDAAAVLADASVPYQAANCRPTSDYRIDALKREQVDGV